MCYEALFKEIIKFMIAFAHYPELVTRLKNTITEETMYKSQLLLGLPTFVKGAFHSNTDCLFLPRRLRVVVMGALALFLVACAHDPIPLSNFTQNDLTPKSPKISAQSPSLQTSKDAPASWNFFKVSSQPMLEKLFKQQRFNEAQLKELLNLKKFSQQLQQLRSAHELRVKHRPDGSLEAITLVLDNQQALYIALNRGKFEERLGPNVGQTEIRLIKGNIYNSFFAEEGERSETVLSEKMRMELSDIFRLDENFIINIQLDDSFTVLYEKEISQEQKETILAAGFFTQGKVYRAVRYKDEQGNVHYFTPNGDSLHPSETKGKIASLQMPMGYTKVTSTFGMRKHPILRKWLFHSGVDYAAPTGTPIVAAAEATINFMGRQRGYGKMVILKHDDSYETAYAHMSGFAQGLKEGDRVSQGTVIGYVGQTGFATGPHLHFEVRINGVQQDPLVAQALPPKGTIEVAKVDKARFSKQTKDILAQLDDMGQSPPTVKALPVFAKPEQAEETFVKTKTTQSISPLSKEGEGTWLFWPGYAGSVHVPTENVDHQ